MVSQTIAPNPSICAPNCIFMTSAGLRVVEASSTSDESGVYGVTNELGETVVGWDIPVQMNSSAK